MVPKPWPAANAVGSAVHRCNPRCYLNSCLMDCHIERRFDGAIIGPGCAALTGSDAGKLSFNPASGTFTGTPSQDVTGEIEIKVSAREGSKLVGADSFKLTIAPVNDAPIVGTAVADQSIAEDTTWSFQVPAGTFTDVDNASIV